MTSAAWLVMSMNGGRYFERSSISVRRPLTLPPRRGGMISKLMKGPAARSRCSMTFMRGATGGGDRPGLVEARLQEEAYAVDHWHDVRQDRVVELDRVGLALEGLAARAAVD